MSVLRKNIRFTYRFNLYTSFNYLSAGIILIHFLGLQWLINDYPPHPVILHRKWPMGLETSEMHLQSGETLALKILKERKCIGYKDNDDTLQECKTLTNYHLGADGRCPVCKSRNRISNCSRCHGICVNPEGRAYCKQPHIIYLAAFTPDFIKVGVSTERRWKRRIAEQGANLAVVIARAVDGAVARTLESKIKDELGIPDRAHESIHLQSLKTVFNLDDLLNTLSVQYQKLGHFKLASGIELVKTPEIYDLYNPYVQLIGSSIRLPQAYSGSRLLYGEIAAVKGWSLIISYKGNYSVFNLHNLVGYILEEGGEKPRDTLLDFI
jgi:hypothetical protein